MGKRKKHLSEHSQQKIRQLQHKNEFARRLKAFATAYSGKEAAAQLTNQRINEIYGMRIHTLKLLVAEGSVIAPGNRNDIEAFLLNRIKCEKIAVPDGSEVAFSDFLSVGFSLSHYIYNLNKSGLSGDDPFQKAFATYNDLYYAGEDANHRLYRLIGGVCDLFSDIGSHHHWIDPVVKFKLKDDNTVVSYLELHRVVPVRKTFMIDHQPRQAIKLGWARPYDGVSYLQLSPSALGMKGNFSDIPLDIYIQAHALQRLSERIDCVVQPLIHFFVIIALDNPQVTFDNHGKLLIEYRIDKYKAGYLRADIVEGCILIRTFLFLTNNGTPEGQKIEQMTGLGKLDKKYLAIDKLSAFMSSDIRSNEAVMQLLRKSGCECLLDLHENLKKAIINENCKQSTGALISRYLELDKVTEPEFMETSTVE